MKVEKNRVLNEHEGTNANPLFEDSGAHRETSSQNEITNLGILKEKS